MARIPMVVEQPPEQVVPQELQEPQGPQERLLKVAAGEAVEVDQLVERALLEAMVELSEAEVLVVVVELPLLELVDLVVAEK